MGLGSVTYPYIPISVYVMEQVIGLEVFIGLPKLQCQSAGLLGRAHGIFTVFNLTLTCPHEDNRVTIFTVFSPGKRP